MRVEKVLGIAVFATLFTMFSFREVKAFTIPEGLSFNNNSLAGLNEEEAKNFIEDKYKEEQERKIKIDLGKAVLEVKYGDISSEKESLESIFASIEPYISSNVVKRFEYKESLEKEAIDLNVDLKADKESFKKLVEEKYPELASASEAIDAKIERVGDKFVITKEKDVQTIDLDETFSLLEDKLKESLSDIDIVAAITTKEAKIKEKDLESIKDILGTYTTNFGSSAAARANNIAVGAAKINGSVLMPGETLSGYELMHPFTIANGYKTAGAYSNGQVIDSVGGGVCQIATTLYNASLRAEIGIKQRNNHSMTVSYVPASSDAAIAGTVKDLKITNTYDTPIYVEAFVNNRNLTFNIWGKETRAKNRTIEFIPEVLGETAMGVTYQNDASLPLGKEIRVSTGHNGRVSKLWKVVKLDGVEKERSLISSDKYNMSNSIVRRGTGVVQAVPEQNSGQTTETQATTTTEVTEPNITTVPTQDLE